MFDSTVDSNGNSNVDSNVDSDVNSNIDSNVDSDVVSTVGSDVVSIADSDVHSNNWIPMLIQMLFHFESNVDVIFFKHWFPCWVKISAKQTTDHSVQTLEKTIWKKGKMKLNTAT